MARASNASSRCTRRRSPASRWCGAATCAGPSYIICGRGAARARASRRRPTATSPRSRRWSARPRRRRSRPPPKRRAPRQPKRRPCEVWSAPAGDRRAAAREDTLAQPRTLFDKIWESHLVGVQDDGTCLLYIDRHLVHEVTSPQAFAGLRMAGRRVRRPEATLAVADHNVPTTDRSRGIADAESRIQVDALARNCAEFGVAYFSMADRRQGIVHIIGPEQGFTLPGTTIVCGDSHTATHGAFGALAFGIGTSEVEHVLATQCLLQSKPKSMQVRVDGTLARGVTAKDLILALIAKIGIGGGTGHVIEYTGAAIRALTMEGRMTLCNMSIEGGARAGMIAPDDTTFNFLCGRTYVPQGEAWDAAVARWRTLPTDPGATYDQTVTID